MAWLVICPPGLKYTLCLSLSAPAAVRNGGAQWMDTYPFAESGQQPHPDLHDPDRSASQSPEWARHAHAADQGLHACGGDLHRQVPTMHHCGLHDVPHHQMMPSP